MGLTYTHAITVTTTTPYCTVNIYLFILSYTAKCLEPGSMSELYAKNGTVNIEIIKVGNHICILINADRR